MRTLDGIVGTHKVRAVMPSADDCVLLGLSEPGAALVIDRLGCAKGEPVEWRHTLVRGDRFSVVAEFRPPRLPARRLRPENISSISFTVKCDYRGGTSALGRHGKHFWIQQTERSATGSSS